MCWILRRSWNCVSSCILMSFQDGPSQDFTVCEIGNDTLALTPSSALSSRVLEGLAICGWEQSFCMFGVRSKRAVWGYTDGFRVKRIGHPWGESFRKGPSVLAMSDTLRNSHQCCYSEEPGMCAGLKFCIVFLSCWSELELVVWRLSFP